MFYLKSEFNGAIDKELRERSTVESFREQLLSLRFGVDKYGHRFPLYTKTPKPDGLNR